MLYDQGGVISAEAVSGGLAFGHFARTATV
jgi:hypothetical protein